MALSDIIHGAGALANPFGAPSVGQWNLTRGVFKGLDSGNEIVFFFEKKDKDESPLAKTAIEQITDGGSRRLAVYEYPYRNGQRLEDLGRSGETYTFNIKFFGDNYQTKFQEFLNVVVNARERGSLLHPVRSANEAGALIVRFQSYEFIHRHDEWNSVTIRATFIEDNTDQLLETNTKIVSQDSALRSALQTLTNAQAFIGGKIFEIGALFALPSAVQNSLKQRLDSIISQSSALVGQMAATFAASSQVTELATSANGLTDGITALNAGTVGTGSGSTAALPPVFQVGFDPTTQASIDAQLDNFINANQITPQQAVFLSNQTRQGITAAVNELTSYFGNSAFDMILSYREMANSMQEAVESCISQANSIVKVYTVPYPMSLRTLAKLNNISYTRQNEIESLNPYLSSVNYIPAGEKVTVPVA